MDREKTLYDLGTQQRRVVEIAWQRDGATVREVWEELSPDRRLAYTSILSTMQKLEASGWLSHTKSGRQYVYSVTRSKAEAEREALAKFIRRVYGGDPAPLLFQMLRAGAGAQTPSLRTLVDLKREVA